jgi:hypothetical protein
MISYTAQLRIEGRDVDAVQITRELGLAPTQTRQVGEHRSANSVWEKALWALDAKLEWESLEEGLRALLAILSPHRERIREYQQRHDVYFYCGQFSAGRGGGPRLSAEILKLLADFGVPIHLQVYLSDDST